MKFYFQISEKGIDTNLPNEMQVWLKDCLNHIGESEFSDDILSLLNIGLEIISAKGKCQEFIDYKHNSYNGGAEGDWCVSPFDAIINILKGNMITIEATSDEEIGEYYCREFSELYDEFIEEAYDYDTDSMEDFALWLQECEVRGLMFSDDGDKVFDFDDCESYNNFEQIKSELKDLI